VDRIRTMDIELGSVSAYRAWTFGWENKLPGLFSLGITPPELWPYGTIEALCLLEGSHSAPVFNCTCGIHAVKEPYWTEKGAERCAWISGEIDLFGKIIIHTKGYRAQYARVQKVYDYLFCTGCGKELNIDDDTDVVGVTVALSLSTTIVHHMFCGKCYAKAEQRQEHYGRSIIKELLGLNEIFALKREGRKSLIGHDDLTTLYGGIKELYVGL